MSGDALHARFMKYVNKSATGCWRWHGVKDSRGAPFKPYGRFWFNGTNVPAHRFSWLLFVGEIPDGLLVLHRCDVPDCVNPKHLFLGTHLDNTRDMMLKGRNEPMLATRRGASSNFSKLSAKQVKAIRADNRLQRVIAAEYGITQTGVSHIKSRKTWKHI